MTMVLENFQLCEQLQLECTSIMWTSEIRMQTFSKMLESQANILFYLIGMLQLLCLQFHDMNCVIHLNLSFRISPERQE
jgi:hypothetical protein